MTENKSEKEQLLQLIIGQGILHDSAQRPVLARDGKTRLSWVMNFLGISLEQEGLQLAARQLLPLLGQFQGKQLATIGTAAIPLMTACILESGGKYTGLMVRPKRKTYGTASLIDGRIRHHEPVIVLDDSIGSGTNMLDCISKLEAEGLYVEGCVCLMRFGYDSGYATLLERGYRVLALFDHLQDIAPHHPNDWQPVAYPIKHSFQQIVWDDVVLPDYLSPFQVIRRSIRHYWETGKLPQAPRQLNQTVDTAGGLWLSLRAQDGNCTSQGRHGFWHFPDEKDSASLHDLSKVAWLLAVQLQTDPQREQRLEQGALALSLHGALEACHLGDFDPRQHALVIRSQASPWKMGGALPNMPGIRNAAHLLHHARFQNTRLRPYEPFTLYRHTVTKCIEPGAEWPFGGESLPKPNWDEQSGIIQPLIDTLLAWVQTLHQQQPTPELLPALFIPANCQWLFLSVYLRGQQVACAGVQPHRVEDLLHLAKTAAQDPRWRAVQKQEAPLLIRVHLLSESTGLGAAEHLQAGNLVVGQDALAIQHEQQFALILPDAAAQQGWNAAQLGQALYQKAGIPMGSSPVFWQRYRSRQWLASSAEPQAQAIPYTRQTPEPHGETHYTHSDFRHLYLGFLHYQQHPGGLINTRYQPSLHQVWQQGGLLNTAYILWLLAEGKHHLAPVWDSSFNYLQQALQTTDMTSHERSYALLALCQHPHWRKQARPLLAAQLEPLQAALNSHGQLPKPAPHTGGHYSVEILALLHAQQAGFFINTHLLDKASSRLQEHAQHYAQPCQYPALLETLTALQASGHTQCQPIIQTLHSKLREWQQASGAFLPEHPDQSPTLFTAQALNALCLNRQENDPGLAWSLSRALHYLHTNTVLPEHSDLFPVGAFAKGGIYSGLHDHYLASACVALTIRAHERLGQWKATR